MLAPGGAVAFVVAERHGLIILIAIGVGAGFVLGTGVIVGAALGLVVVSALRWLYFDVAAIFARRRLMQASGVEQAWLARDSYGYLHLPMVAGIVLFALGLNTTLGHVGEALDTVPAVVLCGGAALYLLGHIAFLFRTTGRVFRRRTVGAVVLLALIPAAVAVPALAALSLVSNARMPGPSWFITLADNGPILRLSENRLNLRWACRKVALPSRLDPLLLLSRGVSQ